MENEKITNCNQCPNRCPADALQCGRGRRYFEQMENPDMQSVDAGERHGHREGRHEREEGRQHSREHSKGYGKGDNLYGLMRACGHYLHHSGETQLFDALDEGEQETLKTLLKKLIDSWEQ